MDMVFHSQQEASQSDRLIQPGTGWIARLELEFVRRAERSVMQAARHFGPLRVQKALYPEGPGICHAIMLHPPAGIVGGDSLSYDINLGSDAHVLLTTPGAGKWYRSDGRVASVRQRIRVASGAICEWLPQESIVYDGAIGTLDNQISLAPGAALIAADMLCLGRTGSGETFSHGRLSLLNRITLDERALWLERGRLDGGGELLTSPVGLAGYPVTATLMAFGAAVDEALRDACRAVPCEVGEGGVTLLPNGLLVARWLGPMSEPGRIWLSRLWSCIRPAVAGRTASEPRIWRT